MPRRANPFSRVEAIGRSLPGAEVTTTWGQPTLKVGGRICVLVRLARVHPDALRDLLTGAHRYISAKRRKRPAGRPKTS